MQELQCIDCIVNFFETENDTGIRDFIFELLFGDFYHQHSAKFTLQLLFSYAMSLEAQKSLETASKWIITNIGNEVIQTIFEQIVQDHFLLYNNPDRSQIPENLTNLCTVSPLFASLFMSIILDMLANEMIKNEDKFLFKMFSLIEIWIEKNSLIPVLAYQTNLSHFSSYMLNPLPGLLYTTVLYPIKHFIECIKSDQEIGRQKFQQLDSLVFKAHLISLKLVNDLSNLIGSSGQDNFKILSIKNLECIEKRLDEYLIQCQSSNEPIPSNCKRLICESFERLAQMVQLCLQYGFTNCSKIEIKNLFSNLIGNISKNNDGVCLMELVLLE